MTIQRFHFDVGNSNTGPIGFCAAVYAYSAEEAARILTDALAELGSSVSVIDKPVELDEDAAAEDVDESYVDYVEVYFNPAGVKLTDIDYTDEV